VELYEQLLLEATDLPENPKWESNERMSTYLGCLGRPIPEGGAMLPQRCYGKSKRGT